ncbi:MAG TPA: hypothetical protein VMP67_00110 [Candidatus Limnocylindria bacterium]|nr:hypothetical protein [Candidatus Limnocylindria bacterium]
MPTTAADFVADPAVSVLAGVVGQQVVDRVPFTVTAWFQGSGASDLVWLTPAGIPDGQGGVVFDTCGLTMGPGENWLLFAYGAPPEPYTTSNCTPSTRLVGEEGEAVLAEVEAVFGAAQPIPPAPTEEPVSPPALDAGEPFGWAWLAGGVGAALIMLLGVAALAVRRRPLS